MPMNDSLGAFVQRTDVTLPGAKSGPLAGLRFAAKDIFDVAGHVTGCGNPDRLKTHGPAAATAPAIEALVAAGATMVGKTVTDELAFGLIGRNFHYGTPVNVNAPGRVTGGSSCGSAAAVAGGLVDFALGSDTGSSVRVPAGLCGVFGVRPSHGRIPIGGVMPLAPSLDTVGWFARDAAVLARVGEVLLGPDAPTPAGFSRLLHAEDAFAVADEPVRAALAPALGAAAALLGAPERVEVGADGGLAVLAGCYRTLLAREAWAAHGAWIESAQPRLGPETAAHFAWAKAITEAAPADGAGDAVAQREAFAARMDALLADGAVLCLPSAPSIAPARDLPPEALQPFRDRTHRLTCIAGLARLPQVSIPAARVEGCPVGLSLVGRRGSDRALIRLAEDLARRLG